MASDQSNNGSSDKWMKDPDSADEEEVMELLPLGPEEEEKSLEQGGNGWDSGSSSHNINDQLEEFRQQWHSELHYSRSQSPGGVTGGAHNQASSRSNQAVNLENEAKTYFLQGMQAEDDGMLNEAIYYYRKSLQLVPDIESRLGNTFTRSPRERVRQDSESSIEGSEIEEDLLTHLEQLNLKEGVLCIPEFAQRMTHISCLPVELVSYILQWLVSADLDFRSLEIFSMVCRGFFLCARDERVWKLACEKVWGLNVGSVKKYGGSWRKMMIERPHILFDGCYICKVTYVRQGEQGMDQFYRPFHLVEYFRYVRFFPDGHVLMLVSPEDPHQSLPKLKHRTSRASGILKGGYKLSDYKVTCVLKRVKTEAVSNKYRRNRQAPNQNETDLSYCVEFDIATNVRRPNAQLVWKSYVVRSTHRLSGQESVNNFDLNKRNFPALIFSRVKSYSSFSSEPLV